MKNYRFIIVFVLVFGITAWGKGFQQKTIPSRILTPVKKLLVDGFINLSKFMDPGHIIMPYFNLKLDGNHLEHMRVTVDGTPMRETSPGQYAGINISDYRAVPGGSITFSIQSARLARPISPSSIQINGSVKIGSLVQITSPAAKSVFTRATLGKTLLITWQGGRPPYTLTLTKVYSGGATWQFYEKNNLLSRRAAINSVLFENNTRYRIGISYKMSEAKVVKKSGISISIDKNSRVPLFYYTYNDIYIGKVPGIKNQYSGN